MSSNNEVRLVGNLGSDPVVRRTQNGTAVCNFTMATDESYTDSKGARQKHTEWHRVVVWGKAAELIGESVKKGAYVSVTGQLRTRAWQDKEGKDRFTTEINSSRVMPLMRLKNEAKETVEADAAPEAPVAEENPLL